MRFESGIIYIRFLFRRNFPLPPILPVNFGFFDSKENAKTLPSLRRFLLGILFSFLERMGPPVRIEKVEFVTRKSIP